MTKDFQKNLDVKIKLATPEDWQKCRDLRLEAITGEDREMFGLTPEEETIEKNKSEQEWRAESNSDTMFSVLAWNDAEAIGLARAKQEEEKVWRIRNGYVKPEFRKMGIGQKMFALRLGEIKRRGATKVRTGIKPDNVASLHVAEKFGFKKVSQDENFITMELDLI